jgi:hypothetical protein
MPVLIWSLPGGVFSPALPERAARERRRTPPSTEPADRAKRDTSSPIGMSQLVLVWLAVHGQLLARLRRIVDQLCRTRCCQLIDQVHQNVKPMISKIGIT